MHDDFEGHLAVRHSRAVVTGITGNWAFAAGTVLLALRRHNPQLEADILVFCDNSLPEKDAEILRSLGAQLVPFTPIPAELTQELWRCILRSVWQSSVVLICCNTIRPLCGSMRM